MTNLEPPPNYLAERAALEVRRQQAAVDLVRFELKQEEAKLEYAQHILKLALMKEEKNG